MKEDYEAFGAERETKKLEKKVTWMLPRNELKKLSVQRLKKVEDDYQTKRAKLASVVADSNDAEVQEEFKRRIVLLDEKRKAEEQAAILRASIQRKKGNRNRARGVKAVNLLTRHKGAKNDSESQIVLEGDSSEDSEETDEDMQACDTESIESDNDIVREVSYTKQDSGQGRADISEAGSSTGEKMLPKQSIPKCFGSDDTDSGDYQTLPEKETSNKEFLKEIHAKEKRAPDQLSSPDLNKALETSKDDGIGASIRENLNKGSKKEIFTTNLVQMDQSSKSISSGSSSAASVTHRPIKPFSKSSKIEFDGKVVATASVSPITSSQPISKGPTKQEATKSMDDKSEEKQQETSNFGNDSHCLVTSNQQAPDKPSREGNIVIKTRSENCEESNKESTIFENDSINETEKGQVNKSPFLC